MKFVIIALFAVVLVVEANVVHLSQLAKSNEPAYSGEVPENPPVPGEIQNIPLSQRACTNPYCDYICSVLGFNHGTCVSSTTCQCYN